MANERDLNRLNEGVRSWNDWRAAHPLNLPISLPHNGLSATFSADLAGSNLAGSNLRGANFFNTDFRSANLSGADLRDTNLAYANFHATNLQHADLTGAILHWTTFAFVDLSNVQGLDKAKHETPSSIDVATLYLSRGRIPQIFLRGCGVPDNLIASIPPLLNAANVLEFYPCFISHSVKDTEFVQQLHQRLQQEHLRVWSVPEDLVHSPTKLPYVNEAIRVHDKVLLVLSENSIESPWLKLEIRKARELERATRRFSLFPISLVPPARLLHWECVDSETGADLAAEVLAYHIPDFSNWKNHNDFEKNFKKLTTDLRASEPHPVQPRTSAFEL